MKKIAIILSIAALSACGTWAPYTKTPDGVKVTTLTPDEAFNSCSKDGYPSDACYKPSKREIILPDDADWTLIQHENAHAYWHEKSGWADGGYEDRTHAAFRGPFDN